MATGTQAQTLREVLDYGVAESMPRWWPRTARPSATTTFGRRWTA